MTRPTPAAAGRLASRSARRSWRGIVIAAAALAMAATSLARDLAQSAFLATPDGTFAAPADDAMHMPTAVAVGPDGRIWVADGAHDRLLRFLPTGELDVTFRHLGIEPLSNPVTVRFDHQGRLWVVDNGHARVLRCDADGAVQQVISPQLGTEREPLDLTDVAVSPAGDIAWLVDNDHHRILRHNLQTQVATPVGRLGESLGQFNYPFTAVTTDTGDVAVVDVINGRVQLLNPAGEPAGNIGSYGVYPGQFYRPKYVAVDAAGNFWVSDGTLNVVQAFTADGRFIDVLRDAQGEPYFFEAPMGLDFDAAGRLLVVELLANRVARVRITHNPDAPPMTIPRQREALTGQQARACTACHMEWMQPLVSGQPTEIAPVPDNPAEHPAVSRAEMCLGCHDASVGDSRRRVWMEHGHQIDIVPPESITVPADLPLADGKVACRTCHSAHSDPSRAPTIEEIVFLRVSGVPSELCRGCHAAHVGGLDEGMHPLTEMPFTTPPELVHPGATATSRRVDCLSCHTGHGADRDDLLVLDPQHNGLCLVCHERLQPNLFAEEVRQAHGREPRLDDDQHDVAQAFQTRVGDRQELLCTTCHLSHDAPQPQYLLAFDPAQSDTCSDCHPEQRRVVDSTHNLAKVQPAATNILGMTAAEGGACSGCHTAHEFARHAPPTKLDPTGLCTSCHAEGRLAGDRILGEINHPGAECFDCHDPHETRYRAFLTAEPEQRCTECHPTYAGVDNGPHDAMKTPSAWPNASVAANDRCLACHRPHGTPEAGLLRIAAPADEPDRDAACLACHPDASVRSQGPRASLHPRDAAVLPGATDPDLPLPVNDAGRREVACESCHNPHTDASVSSHLVRIEPGQTTQDLCLECHVPRENVQHIGHAQEPLRAAGFDADGCRPCHIVHAAPAVIEDRFLWPRDLDDFPTADEIETANLHCVACHREDGPVAPPEVAWHPSGQEALMFNPFDPNDPGYMPLYNEAGEVDPQGTIACRTCHLTHGRSAPLTALPNIAAIADSREMRARQWHVRSFAGENLCTQCHFEPGEALQRFMYYHDPVRRQWRDSLTPGPLLPGP